MCVTRALPLFVSGKANKLAAISDKIESGNYFSFSFPKKVNFEKRTLRLERSPRSNNLVNTKFLKNIF